MSADTQHVNETVETETDDDVVVFIDPHKHVGVLALFGLGVADIKDSLDKQVRDKNIKSTVHFLGSKTCTEFVGGSPVLAPPVGTVTRNPDTARHGYSTVDKTRSTFKKKLAKKNVRNLRKKTKIIERRILAGVNKKPEVSDTLTFGQERRRARLLRVLKKLNAIANGDA